MKSTTHLFSTAALLVALLATACNKGETKYTDLKSAGPSDLTLAFTIERQGTNHRGTMRLKGDKVRTDLELPGGSITIIQSQSDGVILINHTEKTWQRQPAPEMPHDGATAEDLAIVKDVFPMRFTGNSQMISGWKCEEYLLRDVSQETLPGKGIEEPIRETLWIAKEFPEGEEIQRHINRISLIGQLKSIEKATGRKFSIPGFAMKTEVQNGKQGVVTTYTAIKQGELDSSIFEIPSDYLQSLSK